MAIIYIITNELEKVYFNERTSVDTLLEYATIGDAFQIPDDKGRKIWNERLREDWTELDDADYFRYDAPYILDDKWYTECNGHFVSVEECVAYFTKKIRQIEQHISKWAEKIKLKE